MDYPLSVINNRVVMKIENESVLDQTQLKGIQEGIKSSRFSSFIDFSFGQVNSTMCIEYFTERYTRLDQILAASRKRSNGVSKEELKDIMLQVIEALMLPKEYFYIFENNIVVDFDYIYYDSQSKKIKLLYLPFSKDQYDNKQLLKQLFSKVGSYINEVDQETIVYHSSINIYLMNTASYEYDTLVDRLNASNNIQKVVVEEAEENVDRVNPIPIQPNSGSPNHTKQNSVQKNNPIEIIKGFEKKLKMNILLSQVIILAVAGILTTSGVLPDGAISVIMGSVLVILVGEYLVYKLLYLPSAPAESVRDMVRQEPEKKVNEKKKPNFKKNEKVQVPDNVAERKSGTILYDEGIIEPKQEVEEVDVYQGTQLIEEAVVEVDEGTQLMVEPTKAVMEYTLNDIKVAQEIDKTKFTIGRKVGKVDYVIDSKVISGHHGTIYNQGGTFYYEDEKSSNCSYKDGVKLEPHSKTLLENGTVLRFADIDVLIKIYT